MLTYRFSFLTVLLALCTGCFKDTEPEQGISGYVLGWYDPGVLVSPLSGGPSSFLKRSNASHFWRLPLWDSTSRRLICDDGREHRVVMFQMASAQPTTVYETPPDWSVEEIALLRNRQEIVLRLDGPNLKRRLTVCDIAGESSRTLLELGKGDGHMGSIMALDDDTLLVHRIIRREDAPTHFISSVSLADGAVTHLTSIPEAWRFSLSPEGKIVLFKGKNTLYTYCLETNMIKEVKSERLPGYTDTGFCFIDEERVLITQRRDPMNSLGTYMLNLKSGEVRRVSKTILHNPQFIRDNPFLE